MAMKLDEVNFQLWKQQALVFIKGHKLPKHIIEEDISRKYNSDEDEENGW